MWLGVRGGYSNQGSFEEMFHEGRNSNRCGSKTKEDIYMEKVGERTGNKMKYMTDRQIQNRTTGEG